MKTYQRHVILFLLLALGFGLASCEKKKQGKVIIIEQEFVLRQDNDHSYVVDAKGKIRNVGDADVKKIVVTGYCRSCSEIWVVGQWFVSGTAKTPDQKDIVSYLSAGDEAEFSFTGVADIYSQGEGVPEMPEKMEIVVESFETVEG